MEELRLSELLNETDAKRVEETLDKLLSYLNLENTIVCGGLAIRYHLKKQNVKFPYNREFNDLDFQLKLISDLKSESEKEFLTYHYHDYSDKEGHEDDFFIATIEKETKIKTDFFSYNPYIPFDPIEVKYKDYVLKMRNAEDQLATQVVEMGGALQGETKPKHWIENIKGLLKIADLEKADKYFHGKKNNKFESSLSEVWLSIKNYLELHPEQIVEKPTHREPYVCDLCESRNGFTLEPMEKIYKMLGYVE